MTPELTAWLNGLTLTAPFTLADVKELYAMIRKAVDKKTRVEVYSIDHRFARIHIVIGTSERFVDVV